MVPPLAVAEVTSGAPVQAPSIDDFDLTEADMAGRGRLLWGVANP